MPSSTRVVDLPVYLSASLTRLCPLAGRIRHATASSTASADVLCSVSSASPHCCSAYGSIGSLRGHGRPSVAVCDAASERDSGTPSAVGSGGAAQPGSRTMEQPAEGGTPAPRARPKAASRQQIASTPKRATAQAERRLRAQSFTAAATPNSDAAAQEAVRLALPPQPQQAAGPQQTAAGGRSGASDEQPSVAPTAAADPAPASQDQESPITSRQRRAPGATPARAAGGAAKASGTVRAPAHHDRRGHVPPADHHAEAQTGALPPPATAASADEAPAAARPAAADSEAPARGAPEAAFDETRDAPAAAAPRGGGRRGRSATEGSDGSDERRDAPAASAAGTAAVPQSQQPQQPQPPPKAAAGAKVASSLFSPVFSLFGGKPASDVPAQPGGEGAGMLSTGDGGERRTADVSARPPSAGVKGDSSGDVEPAGVVRAADDDVHSENDTQIRVPSGQSSGSQARACMSRALHAHGFRPSPPCLRKCIAHTPLVPAVMLHS